MVSLHPTDLDIVSPNAVFAAQSARRFACRRGLARLRPALSPNVVLPAALLIFGCYALLVLTGGGPDSWQVRQCANGDLQPRSCPSAIMGSALEGAAAVRSGTSS